MVENEEARCTWQRVKVWSDEVEVERLRRRR